jgi:hypothetical protein
MMKTSTTDLGNTTVATTAGRSVPGKNKQEVKRAHGNNGYHTGIIILTVAA